MTTGSAKRPIVAADIKPLLTHARAEGRTCGRRLRGRATAPFELPIAALQAGLAWSNRHGISIDGAAAARYVSAFVGAAERVIAPDEVTHG